MVVGSACHELVSTRLERVLKLFSVLDDLLLILFELWCLRLLQSYCECGDGVIMWTTLVTGEDREVDRTFEVIHGLDFLAAFRFSLTDALAEEDHGSAWSA